MSSATAKKASIIGEKGKALHALEQSHDAIEKFLKERRTSRSDQGQPQLAKDPAALRSIGYQP